MIDLQPPGSTVPLSDPAAIGATGCATAWGQYLSDAVVGGPSSSKDHRAMVELVAPLLAGLRAEVRREVLAEVEAANGPPIDFAMHAQDIDPDQHALPLADANTDGTEETRL